ncbi:hypothetical protein PN36_15440 [Candidatus Thiomargarita nelsonii]|uniref:Uncharacterized protein n=1 Tax=Candidatus Thiomargarita nelsonii TaxID=1003181 RepID=A0A4E0QNW2_9GAMM|nr:hypothetical protein PN36_15440 [Candidatus Thiomargarita nelsonii]
MRNGTTWSQQAKLTASDGAAGLKVDLVTTGNLTKASSLDLWVAIQLPDNTLLFITPQPNEQFSLTPQAFRTGLDNPLPIVRLLEIPIPHAMVDIIHFWQCMCQKVAILSQTVRRSLSLMWL